VQDLLVGSSTVLSNRNVANERIFRRFGSKSWEIRGACWRTELRLFEFGN